MKNTVYLVILFLLLTSTVKDGYAQRFYGGINAGLTASEVSGDRAAGPDKLGWFASVFTNTHLTTYSFLQLELMYVQKGSRVVPDEPGDRDYKFYLQYVEIPVVFKFDFSVFGELPYVDRLAGEFGLSMSVLVDHFEEENGLEMDLTASRPFNTAELNALIGLYYPIGEIMEMHLRFSQGVTPLRPHEGGTKVWYNRGQYNTVWSFGLSFTFF